MTEVHILLEPNVAAFYQKIAENAGLPVEKVISDALFLLAGELSLEAMENKL